MARVLSRYKLLEEVGKGGMAVVHRGLDTALDREVAVKVLHPHLAEIAESRARLEREAQAVAKLRHDNILEIFDYSADGDDRFLVTEFIHGQTLTRLVEQAPIELPEIAEMIVAEVTAALEHAHSLGVIHRDVKPENVMIRASDGMIKLTDFGIAQIVDKERLTVTGQLLGSPAYMSPELVEGGRVDFRTDVFAAGILLYQLATGQLPFRGKNPHEVLKKIAEARFPPPDQVAPSVGPRLARIITKALARDPDARFSTVTEMRRELLADLAEVGIDDPRARLAGYFAARASGVRATAEWTDELRRRAVKALCEAGNQRVAAGRRAAGLALFSRAATIAVDGSPEARAVRELIDGLAQQRRRGRLLVAAGLSLVAAGGSLTLLRHRGGPGARDGGVATDPGGAGVPVEGEAATLAQPAGSPASPATPALGGALARSRPRPSTLTPVARPDLRRVTLPPPVAPSLRDVAVHPFPKNVAIFVDGAAAGAYDGRPIRVSPGEHELRFSNPSCCADATVHLAATDSATPPVRLPWKSARVLVETVPAAADITYVVPASSRGPSLARGGSEFGIRIPPESDGHVALHLTVSAAGYPSRELDLEAQAGQTTRAQVALERKP